MLSTKCQADLIKVNRNIVNISLKTVVFHSEKAVLVKPLIQKHNLDCNILTSHKSTSHLFVLSKTIERAVSSQLNEHLLASNLNKTKQSAFKYSHNTEIVLIHYYDGVLLDLSAAY